MKLSEAAEKVIALAQAMQDYWAAELPKRHPTFPVVQELDKPGPMPPQYNELHDFLAGLPHAMIYELLLVMYLGRGDFPVSDRAAFLKHLKATFKKPEWAVSQLIEKMPLPDYLRDGLEALRVHGIDPDHLFDRPAPTRK